MITPDLVRLSPNVNRDPSGRPLPMLITAQTVIIHCTRSGRIPLNPTEFDGTLNYMQTPGTTSSHWVIARDGRKARVVPDDQQAWHAAEDNDNAWGIELEQAVESDGFTDAQLASLVLVCRGYVEDFGVDVWHATSSTISGFIGHQETAQGKRDGKSDPGRLFNWDWFIASLEDRPKPPVYTREQALWAIHALGWKYGIQAFSATESPRDLHPFDKDVLRDIVSKL